MRAPLAIALLGAGRQALRLARAVEETEGVTLAGVASPHLLERLAAGPSPFAAPGRLLEADAARLLESLRPDAAIVAAATHAHHGLALLCAGRGVPVLVEKPFASTVGEAEALAAAAERALIVPAHVMRYAAGVRALSAARAPDRAAGAPVAPPRRAWNGAFPACSRRFREGGGEALATWDRAELFEILYHSVYLLGEAVGSTDLVVVRARAVSRPDGRPDRVAATLALAAAREAAPLGLALDFAAQEDGAALSAVAEDGGLLVWQRAAGRERTVRIDRAGTRDLPLARGGERCAMIAAFRDLVRAGSPAPGFARAGADAVRVTFALVDALDATAPDKAGGRQPD